LSFSFGLSSAALSLLSFLPLALFLSESLKAESLLFSKALESKAFHLSLLLKAKSLGFLLGKSLLTEPLSLFKLESLKPQTLSLLLS